MIVRIIDTWSIVALLKSEARFNIKVIAITIVNGNTTVDHSSRNALLVLEKLNRLDVPVFIGADNSLIRKPVIFKYHGDDGLFNIFTEKPSADLVQKKHAVSTLEELIEKVRDVTHQSSGQVNIHSFLAFPYFSTQVK